MCIDCKEKIDSINRYLRSSENLAFVCGMQFEKEMKTFEEHHGIFQPIRAIYRDYRSKTCEDLVQDALDFNTFALEDLEVEDKEAFIRDFLNQSVIIGYFAAWIDEDEEKVIPSCVFVGHSVCRPADYPVFAKWKSKFYSITPPNPHMGSDVNKIKKIELPLSFKFKRRMFEAGHAYYFPITIEEQFQHFLNRCDRYFNKKVNKTASKKRGNKKK